MIVRLGPISEDLTKPPGANGLPSTSAPETLAEGSAVTDTFFKAGRPLRLLRRKRRRGAVRRKLFHGEKKL